MKTLFTSERPLGVSAKASNPYHFVNKAHSFRVIALLFLFAIHLGNTQASGANCLLNEHFAGGDGGFTVANTGSPQGPWTYDGNTDSWKANGSDGLGSPSDSKLTSPQVVVAEAGEIILRFCHRYSFEFDGIRWDGGAVFVSVNGAAFTQVPAAAFTQNGYGPPLQGNTILFNLPGFNGDSLGYGSGDKIESIASLGTFAAGDNIRVQFVAAWDEFAKGSVPNWEISGVVVGNCGVSACIVDTDGDGVLDALDECPGTVTGGTVVIGGCDSGVPDAVLPGGCSISQTIAQLAANSKNHGQFVSQVAALKNILNKLGVITGAQGGKIQSCASQASLP